MGFAGKADPVAEPLEVMRQSLYAGFDTAVVWVTAVSMRIQTRVQGRAAR